MEQEQYNKHYVRLNEVFEIIYGFSDAFIIPEKDDVCINEKGGRHFMLKDNGEFELFGLDFKNCKSNLSIIFK